MLRLVIAFSIIFAALVRQAHAEHKTIHVAIDHAPPYSTVNSDGESSGLILDIVRAAASEHYHVRPVPCPLSRCLRMLEQGEVDVMGGLIKTPQRQDSMVFIDPPYMALPSSYVFYAKKGSKINVMRFEDLYGKRIAVMRGAAFFKRFDEDARLDKVEVTSEQIALDLVLKGRVDLAIAVEDTAEVAMKALKQPISQLETMHYRHTKLIYGYMAVSQSFNQSDAAAQLHRAMEELARTRQLDKIIAPYSLPPIPERLLQ